MKSILKYVFHIDKLTLIYKVPSTFNCSIFTYGDILVSPSNVFISRQIFSKQPYIVKYYELYYYNADGEEILIGKMKPDLVGGLTVEVDNQFLYSGNLHLLYIFEQQNGLEFLMIKHLDLCCDANQNLPRKLNDTMHRKDCIVTRKGRLKSTDKGNLVLGTKVSLNVKHIPGNAKERPTISYYFELRPSGCRKPIILRCYNKTAEIETQSHKHYIEEACSFTGKIYRLEVSLPGQAISSQMIRKNGNWSHEEIYRNLTNEDFVKEVFIFNLNRFATLEIDDKKFTLSGFLRLN